MAHEWAEELADLALKQHNVSAVHREFSRRIILTREEMAAGERAKTTPPMAGDIRPAGKDRWMQFDGQSWGPCESPYVRDMLPTFTTRRGGITFSVHPDVAKELEDRKPMPLFEARSLSGTLTHVSLENIAEAFQVPIDLLRGDSDD